MRLLLKNKFIIFSIIISFLSIYPLFHSGFPPTHDGEYHIIRFYEFDKALRSGSLYPRWAMDLNSGYGLPLFNYVYPLPNYVASTFHYLGLSFIDSFKFNIVVASILGSVFFYLWSRKYWGELGALISSVFYSFSPYRFLDIYIRGSVGEVWAISLFPMFLWSITIFFETKKRTYFVTSAISLSLIIFSHNILALMFTGFSIFYILILFVLNKKNKQLLIQGFASLLIGIGIASIFWLPALFERNFVAGLDIFDYSKHFPDLYELLIPSWGSGFSEGDFNNRMSFQIGAANILAVFLSIFSFAAFHKKRNKNSLIILFFLVSFLLIFLLMLKASFPVWQHVPLMSYFQFPWRFLSLEIIICSFLAGSIVRGFQIFDRRSLLKVTILFLFTLPILLGISYSKPAYYHQRNDNYYTTRSNFIDSTNSPGNAFNTIWFNRNLKKSESRIESRNAKIEILKNETNLIDVNITTIEKSRILVNIAYFPGWKAQVNNETIIPNPNQDGLFEITVPKGKSFVKIKFENTNIRNIASLISLLSIITLFGLFIKPKYIKLK